MKPIMKPRTSPLIDRLEARRLLSSSLPDAADRAVEDGFAVTIDFRPDGADAAEGGRADLGRPFGLRGNGLTYGWNRDLEAAGDVADRDADLTLAGIDFGGRYDTLAAVQAFDEWSIEVPDAGATYAVAIVVGDPALDGFADSRWSVEGEPLVNASLSDAFPFAEAYGYYEPGGDGRITVRAEAGGGEDGLLWLRVAEATPLPEAAEGEAIDWSLSDEIVTPTTRAEGGTGRVNGEVVLVGGFPSGYETTLDRVDVLDIESGTFSDGAPIPGDAADNHAAFAADERYVYWVGGHSEDFADGEAGGPARGVRLTEAAWRYDAAEDVWLRLPDLPEARSAAAAVVAGDRLHVLGGNDETNVIARREHWSIDLTTIGDEGAAWDAMPPLPVATNHAVAGVFPAAGAAGGPLVVVAGGEYLHSVSYAPLEHTQVYDVNLAEWRLGAAMPEQISHASSVVADGRLWLIGGQEQGQVVVPNSLSYDPRTDRWSRHTPLPETRKIGGLFAEPGDDDGLPTLFYLAGDMYQGTWSRQTLVGDVEPDDADPTR